MGGPLEENDPSRHWSAAAWGSSRNVRVRRARLKGESGGAEEARLVAQLRVDDTHPNGMNRDWRGVMLCPGIGASTFTTKFPPNSRGTDILPACGDIPTSDPMWCTRATNAGMSNVADRSAHSGGVNAAMADGSVRFVVNDIQQAVWSAMGTRAGGETVNIP